MNTFLAHEKEERAVIALDIVTRLGYDTRLVAGDHPEIADGDILMVEVDIPSARPKKLYTSALKVLGYLPGWVWHDFDGDGDIDWDDVNIALSLIPTPFVLGIPSSNSVDLSALEQALREEIPTYLSWPKMKGGVPWLHNPENHLRNRPDEIADATRSGITAWRNRAEHLSLSDPCVTPVGCERYAAAVALKHFPGDRVLTSRELIPEVVPNTAYQQLTGFEMPVVYGTCDPGQVQEWMELLWSAWTMKLPAVFFTYGWAETLGRWVEKFLAPSAALLNYPVRVADFGLPPETRFVDRLCKISLENGLLQHSFDEVAKEMLEAAGGSFQEWYRRPMEMLADEICTLLEIEIPYRILDWEQVLRETGIWNWLVGKLSATVRKASNGNVDILNHPTRGKLRSNQIRGKLAKMTVGEAHEESFWLTGRALYWSFYWMGKFGGHVCMLKDWMRGDVHEVARSSLKDPFKTHVFLKNVVRVTPEGGPRKFNTMDPWVFLALLRRWGNERSKQVIGTIWEEMKEVTRLQDVGPQTYVYIGKQGISRIVRDPSVR